MITTSQFDANVSWPLFGPKQTVKVKRFWDRTKEVVPTDTKILIDGYLFRVSTKKSKPKSYYYRLSSDFVLHYYKSHTVTKPKGKFQLNEYVLMNLKQIDVKTKPPSKVIAITLYKTETIFYSIYHQNEPEIFDWVALLQKRCTLNNFEDLYMPMEVLGKGSFATVYKVRRMLDQEIMAAKYYCRDVYLSNPHKDKFVSMIRNEVTILREIDHQGIIKVHEMYQMPDKIVLVMDYVHGRDLYQLIKDNKHISERKASDALLALTSSGWVHRDLKLENILLENKLTLATKIVDFGFAEPINNNILTSKAGTPGYIAPEVFQNEPYGEKGDMFSLGIILFSMIGGYSPFKGRTYKRIMNENKDAIIQFDKPVWDDISPECKHLITLMTQARPINRISFTEIFQHKWMLTNQTTGASRSKVSGQSLKFEFSQAEINSYQVKNSMPRSFYRQSAKTSRSNRTPMSGQEIEKVETPIARQGARSQDNPRDQSFELESEFLRELQESTSIGTMNLDMLARGLITFNMSLVNVHRRKRG